MEIDKNLFEGLAPINDADNGIYSVALKSGIDSDDIKNIALSGAYGSGKSSILKTFENTYKNEYDFLNISLADFEESKKKENIDIERSILQKMFYTVRNEEIPFSRFKRIRDIDKKHLEKYTLYGFIWLISFLIFYKNKDLPEFLELFKFDVIYYICMGISLIGLFLFLPKIISLLGNIDLSKINLKSGEIDLGESKDSSILNKNIDEILYFFKVTEYNVVVFEDLDRHDKNIEIYLKLREINLILNNSKDIERNITFIYAIKDDNFTVENRTKFFDLIIPVIPFVDYSNSAEKLKNMLNSYKIIKEIPKEELILTNTFIDKICLYIDNMRLLKNIFYEFVIYKEKLENKKLKNCKLFSMVVYKNLFPDDFAKLCLKDGLVYNVLSNKNDLIENGIKLLDEEINVINEELENLKKLYIDDIEELKDLYILYLLEKIKVHSNRIYFNNKTYDISILNKNENFNILLEATDIYSDYNQMKISFSSIVDRNLKTFNERKELILKKDDEYFNELKIKIETKEDEKLLIKLLPLKELINNHGKNIFDDKFKNKGLLVFLLSNGYIDDKTYTHYISHFYEESITKEDRDFILVVQGRQNNLGYEFKLTKLNEIINKFDDIDFKRKEILNYCLFEYLLENISLYQNQYNYFLGQILESKNIQFIDGYIESKNKCLDRLFIDITSETSWLWTEIQKSNFKKDKKDKYFKFIMMYIDILNIKKLNVNSELSKYVIRNDFLIFSKEIDSKKLELIIKTFDIKFEALDNIEVNKDLFKYIYLNNNYKITYQFIENILKEFNENEIDLEFLNTKNYTIIKSSSCKELQIYIEKHISTYIEEVFLLLNSNINEDTKIVMELLNHKEIDLEDKKRIIKMQNILIEDISQIKNNELEKEIFLESKVKATWNNVLTYFETVDLIDESLEIYLNIEENYKILSKSFLKENEIFIQKLVQKLSRKIIECKALSFESFIHLLKSNRFIYVRNIIDLISSDDKVKEIIKINKINLTQENLNDLINRNLSLALLLVEKKKIEYLNKQSELTINSKLLELILNTNEMNPSQKKQIAENVDINLIDNDKVARLLYSYVKNKENLELNYIEKLLLNISQTYIDLKINLILEQEKYLENQTLKLLFKYLPEEYAKISNLDGKHTKLKDTKYNLTFSKLLKDRNFVYEPKIEKNQIRLITKKEKGSN